MPDITDTQTIIGGDSLFRALVTEDELYAAECEAFAGRLLALADIDDSGYSKTEGHASMAQWVVATRGVGHTTAAEWVRVGHALRAHPQLARRFRSGELSWDKVKAATRLAEDDPGADIAGEAASATVAELSRRVRASRRSSASEERRDRYVSWWWDDTRPLLHLEGVLPDDQGVVVAKALDLLAHDRLPDPHHENDTAIYETYEAGCADALYRMASQALGSDRRADTATVVMRVDALDLTTSAATATVEDRPVLPETALRFACDARIEAHIDSAGATIGVGRRTRSVPGWLRRKIHARDGGCVFPGCGRTRWVHRHHIEHWAHGGPTDLGNLVTLCRFHHHLIHEGGCAIHGDPNQAITWIRPNGTRYEPHPVPSFTPRTRRQSAEQARAWEAFRIRSSAHDDTSWLSPDTRSPW